jgi:haloalkane dehalogenase
MVSAATDRYPFTGKYLTLDRWRYHYIDEGAGDPILMIHGNPSWSFFYRNLIQTFADRYRVIAPDHLGCGLSDKPDPADYHYTLEQRVDDLEQLILQLDLRRINLVVHDWGGMIGLACAVRHPERFQRLILLNTAAFPNPRGQQLPLAIRLCRHKWLGPFLVQGLNAFSRGATHFCTVTPMSHTVRQGYLQPYQSWRDRRAIYEFVRDIPLSPDDPSYATMQKTAENLGLFNDHPILILWGEKDFVFDEPFLRQWQTLWPHATVKTFTKGGHYLLEDAGNEVATAMSAFLQDHPIEGNRPHASLL